MRRPPGEKGERNLPSSVNVVCMKWGTVYDPQYVNKLYSMVKRHLSLPFRFVCFTDDARGIVPEVECQPLPEIHVPPERDNSPWRKLALFRQDLGGLEGKTLFLDLDVVIVAPIDELVVYTDKIGVAENWTQRGEGVGNTSVFTFVAGANSFVLDRYYETIDTLFDHYRNEQIFASKTLGPERIDFFPDAWVRSFKRQCMPGGVLNWIRTPTIPQGTKIVAFHGNPKPPHAIAGEYPGKWYKHCRPTPWVAEHWQ